jgi:hypothetical protein
MEIDKPLTVSCETLIHLAGGVDLTSISVDRINCITYVFRTSTSSRFAVVPLNSKGNRPN